MRSASKRCLPMIVCAGACLCPAQTLVPRAYVVTPIHTNAITLSQTRYDGELLFDGALPIQDAQGRVNVSTISLFHTFGFYGRSANIAVVVPYGFGTFSGTVAGDRGSLYRSGLFNSAIRMSVNLKGGPAMDLAEFSTWQQKTLLGISFTVVPPTGQYDPNRLINFSPGRWAMKPEVGLSRRWGRWIVDAYGGFWFYSSYETNVLSRAIQTQAPIGVTELHLSYDIRNRFWFSADGNFWYGGATASNTIVNGATRQKSSRIGVTASVPITRHQSVKVGFGEGAYARYGGKFRDISLAWQYSWLGRPE